MIKFLKIIILISLFPFSVVYAQDTVAIKTNILYGIGSLTPNIGFEIGIAKKGTIEGSFGYNPWNVNGNENNNKKLAHWLGEIEYRYWLEERFKGHFFGFHTLGSQYNISQHNILSVFDSNYRYQGYALGGGISYGYQLILNKNWNIEFTLGGGIIYFDYDKYNCKTCGAKIGNETKLILAPTKAGISLIYLIK